MDLIKHHLLQEIDDALAVAKPSLIERPKKPRKVKDHYKNQERVKFYDQECARYVNHLNEFGYITFKAGTCKFKVSNTQQRLEQFKKKVKKARFQR